MIFNFSGFYKMAPILPGMIPCPYCGHGIKAWDGSKRYGECCGNCGDVIVFEVCYQCGTFTAHGIVECGRVALFTMVPRSYPVFLECYNCETIRVEFRRKETSGLILTRYECPTCKHIVLPERKALLRMQCSKCAIF